MGHSLGTDHPAQGSPLGKETAYQTQYAPELLYPIPRATNREGLRLGEALPFVGEDRWTAYELSWLNSKGKPEVAMGEFIVPAASPNIIESKSLKLYLNSFNQSRFESMAAVQAAISKDLGAAAGQPVTVSLVPASSADGLNIAAGQGFDCIDDLDIEVDEYRVSEGLLKADTDSVVTEQLVSHLLKSNCPVTGQPDWASIYIDYAGPQVDREGLMRYLIAYREHQEFHEHCVERIFVDLMALGLERLTVTARYVRRGGLDINPVRSTDADYTIIPRTVRQ